MIKLHRTTGDDPQAVIEVAGQTLITSWSNLLDLRELVASVPPEAAHNEKYPRFERGAWAASGSLFGIALMMSGTELHFEASEWEELADLLYCGDVLLMQVDVAEIADKPQPRIAEAIKRGDLFAFQVPELRTRQWRIPRLAAVEWSKSR